MCARAQEWFQVADSILDPPEPETSTLLRVKVIFWSDSATLFGLKDSSFHLCVASVGAPDGDHSGKWGFPLWIAPAKTNTDHLIHKLVA